MRITVTHVGLLFIVLIGGAFFGSAAFVVLKVLETVTHGR